MAKPKLQVDVRQATRGDSDSASEPAVGQIRAKAPARAKAPLSRTSRRESNKGAENVVASLRADYPEAACALNHRNPFELLIATILSAQCTDQRVNQVTPALFARYPAPRDFCAASSAELEQAIQSTGFFRNKAKNIQACCRRLVALYDGRVPQDMAALVELPGVGRKTANVVLGVGYGIAAGVVVDTHVGRISRRLGLTPHEDAVKAEADLMAILPQGEWIDFSHRMIFHGRKICAARKPLCTDCSMSSFCPKIGLK